MPSPDHTDRRPTRTDASTAAQGVSSAALEKERALREWLIARGSVLIGFSGGVDSAYLAAVAMETLGPEKSLAVIGRSASYPAAQWETAHQVARQVGIPVLEVNTDELNDPRYAANPTNRCYFCKSELWSRLAPIAEERGFAVVVDGGNADDRHDHRPGAQAARERGVESPLAEVGFTKAEIRERSRVRHLPTAELPSSPCLSSRLPYGTAVTPERLQQVERAEAALRALGIEGDLRVRHFGSTARVELTREALAAWDTPQGRATLEAAVAAGDFTEMELHAFRSGTLNVLAGVPGAH